MDNIAKVSIVGVGMRSHFGTAAKMFTTLASEGINIIMITTSEIKISCVVDAKYAELAVRALHETFALTGVAPTATGMPVRTEKKQVRSKKMVSPPSGRVAPAKDRRK